MRETINSEPSIRHTSDSNRSILLSKNITGLFGYQHSLFSLFYFRKLKAYNNLSYMAGSELIMPINSIRSSNPGLFLLGAIQEPQFLFQVGVGWLDNDTGDNISWKCGFSYFPSKLGVGVAYSPLTGFGTNIVLKFR
jgi:hypothetical protein